MTKDEFYGKVKSGMNKKNIKNINILENIYIKKTIELLLLFVFCLFYRCPFRLIFHIDCPGCGMTRAMLSVLRMDFRAALRYHCLFPLVILGGIYYVFREPIRRRLPIGNREEQAAIAAAAVLFMIRWIAVTFI